jgi:hypothetical protein
MSPLALSCRFGAAGHVTLTATTTAAFLVFDMTSHFR